MARGKSINIFLLDDAPTGRVKCSVPNWTGVVYKIPRTELEKCKDVSALTQSGVYFLFGIADQTDENMVYIGQAGLRKNGEGILNRLQEHRRNPEKDYWTEAVVFINSDKSYLGPTEISYLENRFYALAREANRYLVKNGNDPTLGNVSEEKESELEEFIDNAKIVMGMLGYKVFEKLDKTKLPSERTHIADNQEMLLHLKRKSGKSGLTIEANCKQTNEGFVVLKGSQIETIDSGTIPSGVKISRQKAIIDANGILQEDVLFKSPSYAAAFVLGGHANGLTEWKTNNGKTLKEIENSSSTISNVSAQP